jgi:drug/metabolite transporter (DMT)-like permease
MTPLPKRDIYIGISLAILATLIWSGNFIVARGVIKDIPPVTLAFYRWVTATLIIFPFAQKYFLAELPLVKKNFLYFLLTAATGISLFNTLVYIGGHYSEAINLALIGTTSSPIMSVILARIFLKEKISVFRIAGMVVCIAGVLLLLSKGSWDTLLSFSFSEGDLWVLAAALSFSIYNTMVKKKPVGMNPTSFLFVIFLMGTLLLLPFYLYEFNMKGGIAFNLSNVSVILYLGIAASVIAFMIWNMAIVKLGSGRTALFGNLIPVFSSIEAVFILGEKITWVHMASFVLVITGLVIANLTKRSIN